MNEICSFENFGSVCVFSICCNEKSGEEIWQLALSLMEITNKGRFMRLLREMDREDSLRRAFFSSRRIDVEPMELAVKFSCSWLRGKEILVFCYPSCIEGVREIIGRC